jgi:phage tail sheath protein FI
MMRAKALIDGGQFKEAAALLDATAKPSGNHGTTWTLLKAEAAAGGGNREHAYETLIESAAASPDGRVDAALAKYAAALAKTNREVDADVWTAAAKSTPAKTAAATDEAVDSAALDLTAYKGSQSLKTGLYQLEKTDLFNLLCIPADGRGGDVPDDVYQEALSYCVKRRAMLIVDPKNGWNSVSAAQSGVPGMNLTGDMARNAAIYFPRIKQADAQLGGQIETFVPCGAIAGVMARTDSQRGVWKAPAGIDAALAGVAGLQVEMTDAENGLLNPLGINCLRTFPVYGRVTWGARTLRGADAAADEYKYIPVRRLALFIEESLYRGTQWVVFEPNDEPLWAQIRLNLGAFMNNLFRQGAFQGATPRDAYFVKCDKETTTQNDINLGIVNIIVGFAPLKPAEFVIIKLQQMAGQIAT